MEQITPPRLRLVRPPPVLRQRTAAQTFARANNTTSAARRPLVRIAPPGTYRTPLPERREQVSRAAADRDILVVEDVARILRCTVDTARRIPPDQLRRITGPGRHRLYLREDVLAYVRSLGRPATNAELLRRSAVAKVVGSPSDRGRERQRRRST